tara:strand:- start:699 stop:872 length:174 start_codon:yes stop_codon:yes gene_type:complete
MLELVGLIALLYIAVKFIPDFLMFLIKLVIGLFVLILFANVLLWMFTFWPVMWIAEF